MNAVKRRFLMFFHQVCRCNIGEDHTFFNDFMCVVANHRLNAFNTSHFVKHEFAFNGFKINGAALMTGVNQSLIHIVQFPQMRYQFRIAFAQFFIAFQNARHFGVSQAGMGIHHRFVELIIGHFALCGQLDFAYHTQAIHLRIEGTQPVRQNFR